MIKSLKESIEKIFGVKIYRQLPWGVDSIADIRLKFPSFYPKVIFDVGANIGQMAKYFSTTFSKSEIYSFEPSADTAKILRNNTKECPNVKVFETALGNADMDTIMIQGSSSDKNRIIQPGEDTGGIDNSVMEQVKMATLSSFCRTNNISHIGYLKIDTEGFDLEVVKSGNTMLTARQIDFIEVEVGIHSQNKLHVPFEEIRKYLQEYQYEVFGIYEQVHEWKEKKPILRRVNTVFVSPALYA